MEKKVKKVKIHLTGFGKFQDVPENPTTHLMRDLPSFLEQNPLENSKIKLESFTVLETSGVGSLLSLFELLQRFGISSAQQNNKETEEGEEKIIFVHFGVAASETKFRLESVAWNDATFRVPDERGWQPQNQCIISDTSFGQSLACPLPLQSIAETLQNSGYTVELSTDPGRFVCNWIYYNSLNLSQKNGTHSLFVHIPPFSIFPKGQQLQFIRDLLTVIVSRM